MIYTVTLNPSLDYIASVHGFETGVVNRTCEEELFPGGKGINVSIVLQNLGVKSTALGFLAGFTGQEIKSRLEKMGLLTRFLEVQNGYSRINVKLKAEQETEINGQGPILTGDDIDELMTQLNCLVDGDILVLAGSIPDTLPKTLYRDIISSLEYKKLNIVVDATGELLLQVLPFHPFLIKPNVHELGELFHSEPQSHNEIISQGRQLQKMGARNVLVSMAGDGAILIAESGEIIEAEPPKGKVVNSVGAGDSMVAGFLTGYLKTGSVREAFYTGLCTGSASAFSRKLATANEVRQLLGDYK